MADAPARERRVSFPSRSDIRGECGRVQPHSPFFGVRALSAVRQQQPVARDNLRGGGRGVSLLISRRKGIYRNVRQKWSRAARPPRK